MKQIARFLCCLLLAGAFPLLSFAQTETLRATILATESDSGATVAGHKLITGEMLRPFYANRGYEPAWIDQAHIDELLELVRTAETHGMLPEDFLYFTLQRLAADSSTDRAAFDILASEAFVRYIYNRRFGKVSPRSLDPDINFARGLRPNVDPAASLQMLIDAGDFERQLDEALNHGPWYLAMQDELERLVQVATRGGWSSVSTGPTLHPGDSSARVIEIRARLASHQRVNVSIDNGLETYDAALEEAVQVFQQDHGLDADGVVGPASLRAMNVNVMERIDQLRATLERLRWVAPDVENNDDFLAVNIAGYRIYLVADGELKWTSQVMVGKPYRQTPVFGGRIAYLEFNPTWTVPPGIHRGSVLPAVKKDIGYLAKNHMLVLDDEGNEIDPYSVDWQAFGSFAPYIFRQVPGPWNALGQVKFIFPNQHFVFLHDTNHRELFVRPSRPFSSGCVRLQNPLDLAEILLTSQEGWSREDIDRVVDSQQTRRVILEYKIPIYILYLTAAMDLDGSVLYLEDVYERDGRLVNALNAPMRFDLPAAGP